MLKKKIEKLKSNNLINEENKKTFLIRKAILENSIKEALDLNDKNRNKVISLHPMAKVSKYDISKLKSIKGYVNEFTIEYFNIKESFSFWLRERTIKISVDNVRFIKDRDGIRITEDTSGYVKVLERNYNKENKDKYQFYMDQLKELESKFDILF